MGNCRSTRAWRRSKRFMKSSSRTAGGEPMLRDAAKRVAHIGAQIAIAPALLSFWMRARILGRDRALEGSTQALAIVPGIVGQYLRRAFLSHALAACHHTATIEFGTIFSRAGARIEENAYIGPRCHLGLVH